MSLPSAIRTLSLPAVLAALSPGLVAQTGSFEGVSPYFGVYFGTFDNGQGRWGMAVSWRGLGHFDFIGRFSRDGPVLRSGLYFTEVYDGGSFGGSWPNISGQITDGAVSGIVE